MSEICISLAESFELPGFLALNQAIIAAISNYPDRANEIGLLALVDLQQAQTDVLAGDRTIGGNTSAELAKLATKLVVEIPPTQIEQIDEIKLIS